MGLWSSIRRRDLTLAAVAIATIISEFLPIVLNNIPFRVTQTFLAHEICTWIAIGVLSFMLAVVLGTFLVRWPGLPVDPSTVAGAMYYVADSKVVEMVEGYTQLNGKERNDVIKAMRGRFEFGEVWGVSGRRRVGVDVAEGLQ